ncbi:MAG: Bug family tripartite tricarboxylate transporter substrate binding protein, partial [Afipia sp.]
MTAGRMQTDLKQFTFLASLLISASAILTPVILTPVMAETWPSRIIKATIPFGAGSATDVVPRMFFERLSAELGQPIVVENRAGAGGTVGTASVVRAEPDGYSILAHSSAITIAPAIFTELSYDATKDLSSALMIGYSANVMITSPSKPWKTVQEYIEAA